MTYDPYAMPSPNEAESLKLDALRYLQMIYRDPQLSTAVRMRAAGLAIGYEVPKLAVTAQVSDEGIAELLDRRLKRIEEMKLIEAEPIAPTNGNKSNAKLPLPRLADRRFRRL